MRLSIVAASTAAWRQSRALLVDDEPLDGVIVSGRSPAYSVEFESFDTFQNVRAICLAQIPDEIVSMRIPLVSASVPGLNEVTLTRDGPHMRIRYWCHHDDPGLSNPFWSLREYRDMLATTSSRLRDELGMAWDFDNNGDEGTYILELITPRADMPVGSSVQQGIDAIEKLHVASCDRLLEIANARELVLHFQFPLPVRSACEQYLMYFSEFLREGGVEIESSVREAAGEVLFSIMPVGSRASLARIYEALSTYLRLPESAVTVRTDDSPAVQRLAANIAHLQYQLKMAQLLIESQATTIAAQSTTIQYQGHAIAGWAPPHAGPRDTSSEELFGGTLALTTARAYGVEVNLAEVYRRLRGLFGK